MKSPYVGELTPNDVITAQFLVTSKEIRQKKTGEPYLSLLLADKTGEVEGKMWDNVPEVMDTFERDHFVKVKGLLQIYQKRAQFTIHRLRRLQEHEVDAADYFPCADRDPEEMFAELRGIISGIGNEHLRALLDAIFDDPSIATPYKTAPAAKTIHHACRGGLLQHVLSLCALARVTAAHYPEIDLDLVLAGAILHDIGKIDELTYARSFGYSSEGQLLGHIVIGLRIVGDKLRVVPAFPSKLRALVDHLIVSHHGELEFGSPKVPAFPEALLLHHLDNLDSKMEAMRAALKRESLADGEFTGWVPSLERVLLRKERYLAESAPLTVTTQEELFSPSNPGQVVTDQAVASETLVPPSDLESPSSEASALAKPIPEKPVPATPNVPVTPEASTAPGIGSPAKPQQEARKPHSDAGQPRPTLFGEKLQAVLNLRK